MTQFAYSFGHVWLCLSWKCVLAQLVALSPLSVLPLQYTETLRFLTLSHKNDDIYLNLFPSHMSSMQFIQCIRIYIYISYFMSTQLVLGKISLSQKSFFNMISLLFTQVRVCRDSQLSLSLTSHRGVCLSSHFPGIVPSSVVLTGFQVMSRVFLTWAITHSVKEVRVSPSL